MFRRAAIGQAALAEVTRNPVGLRLRRLPRQLAPAAARPGGRAAVGHPLLPLPGPAHAATQPYHTRQPRRLRACL